jgi:hypothetical protein
LGDAEIQALAVLAHAVDRCRFEDVRTPEVFAALELLASRAAVKWPFTQFRDGLDFAVGEASHGDGRWQNANASMNAIRRAVGV